MMSACSPEPYRADDPGPAVLCSTCGRLTRWYDEAGQAACHPGPAARLDESLAQAWQRLAVELCDRAEIPGEFVLESTQVASCPRCGSLCVRYGIFGRGLCLPCFSELGVDPGLTVGDRSVEVSREWQRGRVA